MPNRLIKESICSSDSLDKLSWFEEVLFYRLIVNCDDYGRFDGRAAIIKNRLFPLKENLTVKAVTAAINSLASAGLVTLYVFEGKPYLYLPTWNKHQSIRAKKSKYPQPPEGSTSSENICMQMLADAPVIQSNPNPIRESESESNSVNARKTRDNTDDAAIMEKLGIYGPDLHEAVASWLRYKKQKRQGYQPEGLNSLLSRINKAVGEYGVRAVIDVIEASMSSNYQGILWDRLKDQGRRGSNKLADQLHQQYEELQQWAAQGDD